MGIFNRNKKEKTELKKETRNAQNVFSGEDGKALKLNKISCAACGGTLSVEEGRILVTCQFCGNQFSIIKESPDFIIDRGVLVKYSGENSEVIVPQGVRAIGILAFHQQSSLTKIVLPEGLNELQGIFFGCSKLEAIILPDSLESIPRSAFTDCVSLKTITLPKNLKSIGELAFYNCKSLTCIELPKKLESVETTVFMNCESLKEIFCYENTRLNGEYFVGCNSLKLLNILDSKTGQKVSEKKIIKCQNNYSKIEQ